MNGARAEEVVERLLASWNSRDLEGARVRRILTAFDLLPAAEQLLGMRLRPAPGTWRGWLAVRAQRALAWRARLRR